MVLLSNCVYLQLSECQNRHCSFTERWPRPEVPACHRVPGAAAELAGGCFSTSVHTGCPVALSLPLKVLLVSLVGQEESGWAQTPMASSNPPWEGTGWLGPAWAADI